MDQIPSFRNSPLTMRQNSSLPTNLRQAPHHLPIPTHKPIQRIRNANLTAKLQHQFLSSSEVMARNPGEQMVDRLELKTTVEKV